jgi:hypothetical protein
MRRPRKQISRWALAFVVLGVLGLAAVIVGLLALEGIHPGGGGNAPAKAVSIHLRGIGSWDPFGPDKEEHSAAAPNATDKNRTTYWSTEHYRSFTKPGVGLLLDSGHPVKANGITIVTDTPGFTAQIQAGNQRDGLDFHAVSPKHTIDGTFTIPLDLHEAQRYFVVWITKLPPGSDTVEINEVSAS